MTDQRYRPLAVGEVIEEGDEFDALGGIWRPYQCAVGCKLESPTDAKLSRRPIPETAWREPVGESGYPYPPGTVVENLCSFGIVQFVLLNKNIHQVIYDPRCDSEIGRRQLNSIGTACKHRVVDYRPDLCESQTDVSEPQADLCGTSDTQAVKKSLTVAGPSYTHSDAMREKSEAVSTAKAVIRNAGQAKPRKVDEPEDEDITAKDSLTVAKSLVCVHCNDGLVDIVGESNYSEEHWQCPKCDSTFPSWLYPLDTQDELERLRAENETLRKQGSVYNGKSAEEWYTLYCQSVLGSDSVSGDTRDADVMRDDLPEYLL